MAVYWLKVLVGTPTDSATIGEYDLVSDEPGSSPAVSTGSGRLAFDPYGRRAVCASGSGVVDVTGESTGHGRSALDSRAGIGCPVLLETVPGLPQALSGLSCHVSTWVTEASLQLRDYKKKTLV